MPTLDALLQQSADGNKRIYTSALAQVEVAFAASEQQQRALDPEEESGIDGLWEDPNTIVVVEYQPEIGRRARALIREAITHGWSLKPLDAIHLATAQWLMNSGFPIAEFHTYDGQLERYSPVVGLEIREPCVEQPGMI